ncbi:MAG TPA: hypothetical protein VGG74_25325 [Kofleriaceae bacterium]|jgi:hypothetical protein
MRITLGDLVGSGSRAIKRYTGTLLAVFVVQTLVMLGTMLAMAMVLASVFSHLPIWDDAVDGDLVSLVICIKWAYTNMLACVGIGFGAVLLWSLASWFLAGGIYGVLAQRPEGRGETARTFGASGAATYLTYARLALCGLPGWLVVLFVFALCAGSAMPKVNYALTVLDLVGPLALTILPAALVAHFFSTVIDYARVELTLRHDSHEPGVIATYLRTVVFVVKHPLSLVHNGLGWLAFAVITLGYGYLAQNRPMYGATGAITLFVIREGVALARWALRFGVLAGQVDLGGSRALPPRRVDVKAPAKSAS